MSTIADSVQMWAKSPLFWWLLYTPIGVLTGPSLPLPHASDAMFNRVAMALGVALCLSAVLGFIVYRDDYDERRVWKRFKHAFLAASLGWWLAMTIAWPEMALMLVFLAPWLAAMFHGPVIAIGLTLGRLKCRNEGRRRAAPHRDADRAL